MSPTAAARRESALRFDLAVQRHHLAVYTAAWLTALLGAALGAFPLDILYSATIWLLACLTAITFHFLYKRGIDRNLLNPIWIAADILFVTLGTHASGGISSPGFLWYAAVTSAAAFAAGRRGAYFASVTSCLAYLVMLVVTAEVRLGGHDFIVAVTRMIFLFGSSYFFLIGIANIQEKRLRIRELEGDAKRQVDELRRLTVDLERANERIQEADRLKSRFLANMSHELRTPMNSIIGFSEILLERLDGKIEPKHHGFIRHIHSSGEHLLNIINGVLDLSKIEAGKMEIFPEYFAAGQAIENVCAEIRGGSGAREIVVSVPQHLPQIETDLSKFRQVLLNLISNALKFSPDNGVVTVSAHFEGGSEDGWLTVSVRDEGIGIAPQHHETIFEEFRQIDGTARREFSGTGLGLAIVRKFVELQGGRVTVESSPGLGSTFSFRLPVKTRAAVVTRLPQVTHQQENAVLVVEDDSNAWELIAPALASAGYTPVWVRHGDEAVRLAGASRPVAITLDLVLPGLDGWEVLKKLKSDAATREIPVVVISRIDHRDLGIALGADDYFVKPVDRVRLLERIGQITHKQRPRLLVIDDDATVHELLNAELSEYAIESALDGQSGIVAARSTDPDLIILDLMMAGMSGFEVAESLKQDPKTAEIPILVLTAKEVTADERRQLATHVGSLVQKGSAREQLVREIRRLGTRRTASPSA